MNRKYFNLVAAGLALVIFVGFSEMTAGQSAPEVVTGRIVDAAGSVPGKTTAPFTIRIDKFTTNEEAMRYVLLLAERGQDGLLDAIQDLDNGYIRVGSSLGYPLSITRSVETEEGRIVRVVTDRPLQMFEVMRNTRSKDYPFGFIELMFDKEGNAKGRMIAAAQVSFNAYGVLSIENLGTRPFELVNIEIKTAEE